MVTYTFTNGTTADANEVNQNFTDAESVAARYAAELAYKGQQATGWANGEITAAEKYTTAAGLQGTVNTGSTTAIFSTDKYVISGPTGNTDTSSETGSIVSDIDYTTTGTVSAPGYFSSIKHFLVNSGGSSVRTVTISRNGGQVAQNVINGGGDTQTHTFTDADYSALFQNGDTFAIRYQVSGAGIAQKNVRS